MRWYLTALHRYADFTGRSRRTDFWMFVLFAALGAIILAFVDEGLGLTYAADGGTPMLPFVGRSGLFGTFYSLALVVPSLAVGARRLHDTGKSGWWQLIGLVPLIGAIALILFFVTDGHRGPNRYGPEPAGDDRT